MPLRSPSPPTLNPQHHDNSPQRLHANALHGMGERQDLRGRRSIARRRSDETSAQRVQEHRPHAESRLRDRPHFPGASRGTRARLHRAQHAGLAAADRAAEEAARLGRLVRRLERSADGGRARSPSALHLRGRRRRRDDVRRDRDASRQPHDLSPRLHRGHALPGARQSAYDGSHGLHPGRDKERNVIHQLTKRILCAAMFASMFTLAAPSANAFDLIVHSSMVLKALKTQVFKERGRYYLQKPDPCSDPYLDNPSVSFKQGRVYVGARFAGRIGGLIGGVCKSATTQPSAVMLSARPVLRSQEAALDDVRLETADDPMVAAVLQSLVRANSLSKLHIDLLQAARTLTAPEKTAPYTIAVRALKFSDLAVQNEELHVAVNGEVEIR